MRRCLTAALAAVFFLLFIVTDADAQQPFSSRAVRVAESVPIRDIGLIIAPRDPSKDKDPNDERLKPPIRKIDPALTPDGDNALSSDQPGQGRVAPNPPNPPSVSFMGISGAESAAAIGSSLTPPDPSGEVGPNHYVQAVNVAFRVWDKAGNPLTPVTAFSTLFAPLGAPLNGNFGDPIVLYDQFADRWIITQFCTVFNPNNHQLVAVSKTGDPTGAYWLYDFVMPNTKFNDYPKLGVWPDGYYMTNNQFDQALSAFQGAGVYAFDRKKMLVGDPSASYIYFDLCPTNTGCAISGMLPADIDGYNPPPAGAPCPFMYFTADEFSDPEGDALRIFDFKADFANPANSTFTERTGSPLAVAAFNPLTPAGRDDIPQPGVSTASFLDAIGDRLMYKLSYRNMGTKEVLVVNHTVDADATAAYRAGVRFYQLRRNTPTGAFTIEEQQTFAGGVGDTENRWMGSAAINFQGDVALGYSVSSATVSPSIRYSARLGTDPAGTGLAQGEQNIVVGGGSQTGTGSRWGDYSHMCVDPTDDNAFWYTQEYYTVTSSVGWSTRIAKMVAGTAATSPRGTVTGTISICAGGAPLSNALIEIQGGFYRLSDLAGNYGATLPPGNYNVTVTAPGYSPVNTTLSITNGNNTVLNVCLSGVPILSANGLTVTVDDCNSNGSIDPGENVTVGLGVQNVGGASTTNLVGTLQASANITNPGPAQNYGAIAPSSTVSRSFTFTAQGTCGATVTASLQLQDGATNFGTVTYSFVLGTSSTATTTFSNVGSVTIPASPATGTTTGSPANPYPSTITVSGMTGTITGVRVNLNGLNHTFPGDVDMLLVGPGGQKMIILSDVIGGTDWVNINYTLDDAAANLIPSTGTPASGTFRPTNYSTGDAFPAPAPAAPYETPGTAGTATFASVFGGSNPNGTWSLYIVDDASSDIGSMAGGWSIEITTTTPQCCVPAPPNDLCVNATPVTGAGNYCGTTVNGNPDNPNGGAVCGTGADAQGVGVWYTFTGDGNDWTFSFPEAAGWDPEINVYSGTCAALTCVGGDDDSGPGLSALFTINTTLGTTYYVYVHHAVATQSSNFCFDVTVSGSCIITCPANIMVNNTPGQCGAIVNYAAPTSSGTCGTITATPASGSFFPVGTTTVNVSSSAGPTCSFTVTVNDTEPPVFTFCPPGGDLGCNPASIPAPGAATATDNCGTPTITSSLGAIVVNGCQRSQTRTYTATDASSNTATCTQTFTWTVDVTPPVFTFCPPGSNLGCNPTNIPAPGAATATDDCGTPTITSSLGAIVVNGCQRSQTRTYTATDGCGNTATCTQTFTWTVDVTPPVFTFCPPGSDLGCNPAGIPAPGAATATDACGTPTITSSLGAIVVNGCQRSQTRTYTATDGCGNTATCTQTFTWTVDVTPPVFTFCPPGSNLGCNPTNIPAPGAATATDDCGTPTITSSLGAIVVNGCQRSQTRTYTATDGCGNTATCTQTFTWTVDVTPPVFTFCPPGSDLGCNPAGIPAPGAATATDACGTPTITSSLGAIVVNGCQRSQTRTYTATDGCGNTATCTQTFTWTVDVTPPVFTFCPPGSNLGCNPTNIPAPGAATATDDCGTPTITSSLGAIVVNGCQRSQTRTYTATDGCGNTATCDQTFTWTVDITPPVFTFCPPGGDLGCNPAGIPAPGAATATDACGTPTITSSLGAIVVNGCQRSQTRTYTATDGCGNTATCTQTFTWTVDVTPPVFTFCPPGSNLGCNPTNIPAPGAATATDDCGTPTITSSLGAIVVNGCQRSQTRTYTATDGCGNTATCDQTFTWTVDITPPVFTFCPPGSNLGCNPTNIPAPGAATATDDCGTPTITSSLGAIVVNGCQRSQTRTYTATDGCGNTATCDQTFTWTVDITPPVFTFCPPGGDLGCNPAGIPAPGAATATDACGTPTITSSLGAIVVNGCQRTQTRTYTATDGCGNTATCTQTFTWTVDLTPPSISCPANVTVSCASQVPVANINAVTVSDNCTGTITVIHVGDVISAQTCTNRYTITRTYRATDACGNQAECTQVITVNDQTPPTLTCPAPVTVSCASAVPAPNIASVTGVSDNCGGVVTVTHVSDVISAQTCANRYTVTRTYRATDVCGNFADCVQIITVNDQTPPVITACPAPVTVSCASAVPAVNTALVTATDNCGGTVTITHVSDVISNQTCANRYTLTRTYRATDVCGNFTNCVQVITVNDQTAPVITCPANITVTTPVGSCTAVVNFTVTATDNCGTVTVTSVPASGSAFPIGTTTVTSTATDACGNTATCTFTVTVNDAQLPVITAQPANRTVCAGTAASFSVTAITSPSANGPLSYQWQLWNGTTWTDISGATAATYTINSTTVSQNNTSYRVRVIGLCTTVISNHATLVVNPNPTVSITPSIPPALLPGQNLSLTAQPNPAGGGSYQWQLNGANIAGATSQTLEGITVDRTGLYRVIYTDANGCVGTSAALEVTAKQSGNLWVYPNPNQGVFNIRFYNRPGEEITVRVLDNTGREVHRQKTVTTGPYTNIQVNLNRQPVASESYIVEIRDSQGVQVGAKRILVYR